MAVERLLWSRRGEVACHVHAPSPSSQRWSAEGWKPIAADQDARGRYQCQHCHPHPVRRRSRSTGFDRIVRELRRVASGPSPLEVINEYLEALPTAVLVADDAGVYVGANTAACRLTGFARQDLVGKCVADLTPPEDLALEHLLWNAFVRSDHQRGTYALLRSGGAILVVRYDAYTNVAPGVHVSFLTTPAGLKRPAVVAQRDAPSN